MSINPSNIERVLKCTASIDYANQFPRKEKTEKQLRGIAMHLMAESLYKTGELIETPEYELSEDDIQSCGAMADYLNQFDSKKVFIEINFIKDDFKTRSDAVIFHGNIIEHINFKGGNYPVSPFDLPMKIEAMIISEYYGWQSIISTIIQPAIINKPIQHEWQPQELQSFKQEIVSKINQPKVFKFGRHCERCPALIHCSHIREELKEVYAISKKELEAIDTTALAESIIMLKHIFKTWYDDAEQFAFRLIENGIFLPGLEIKEGARRREWQDKEAAKEKLIEMLGHELALKIEPITPAAAEKLLKTNYESIKDMVNETRNKSSLVESKK